MGRNMEWIGMELLFSSDVVSDDFISFMQKAGHDHPATDFFAEQLSSTLCEMLQNDTLGWDNILQVLKRAQQINLQPDLWKLQNCYWSKVQEGHADAELSSMLGFDL